jgi:NIPSNAP
MYRVQERQETLYGHYREYLSILEEMASVQRARGWHELAVWAPTVGKGNEVIVVTDYPDLATLERENEAVGSDPEFMKLLRSSAEHLVQGSLHSELLETAPHVV